MRGLRLAATVFVIAASTFAVGFVGTAAADPVDLDPDTDLDGSGVDGDPYIITNASELQAMDGNVSAHYKLGNDIDASDTEDWNGGDGFEPIGECQDNLGGECQDNPFEGEFDGNGHTISNLVIDSDENQVGLFGGTDRAGITNVHLVSADISGGTFYAGGLIGYAVFTDMSDVSVQGSISGNTAVGGVVGYAMETSITDATADIDASGSSVVGGAVGEVHSGTVTRTTVSGDSSADFHTHGGIAGSGAGTITESVSHVDLDGGIDLGGLVGINEGTVSDSYATGEVDGSDDVGGLVGSNADGMVEDSFAIGPVEGGSGLGGLVGSSDGGTVSNSYWNTQTTGQSASGGNGEGLTTVEMTGDRAEDSMEFDFEESWDVSEGDSANGAIEYYPTLQNNPQDPAPNATLYADGNGEDAPYQIEDWYHLDNVRENLDANFTLANDLDTETAGYDDVADTAVNNGHGFESIGGDGEEFTGWFNGSGYTISTLTIDREEDVIGLFGYTDDATIEKVGLEDVDIHGQNNVGGLVGYNNGVISESYVTGDVKGSGKTVGGLISYNDGTVSESYATGTVDGNIVGGLVGYNTEGTVRESYATGTVDGTTAGGLVGFNDTESDVEGSYWDTETTGQDDSAGGGEGLTTDQMTGANATALMSGFEFPAESTEGSWHATGAYPALAWQDTEPFYGVNVTDTNAPVDEGEPLEVTATVTNWGADGDRTVELRDFDGDEQDTKPVTLESGDSEERTLQWDTAVSDVGTGSVTVTSGDDTDSEVVTVETIPQQIDATVTVDDAVADNHEEVEIEVIVVDAFENPVEEATVEVDDADGLEDLTGETSKTDSDGKAVFTATSSDAGVYTLEFSESDAGTADATVTFEPGDPTDVAIAANPANETLVADGENAITYTVVITDANDNPVANVDVEADGSDGTGLHINGGETATASTDADGEVTFAVNSTTAQDAVTIVFTEQQATGDATGSVTFEPGDVASVELDPAAEQTTDAGETVDFEVTAFDEFGNVVEDDNTAFNWTNADNGTFEETAAGEYEVTAELNEIESAPTTVTVEAVPSPSNGSEASSPSASVDSDVTTSVRTVGDELRADVTPSVSDGISESHLEFSNTRTIGLRFFPDNIADEDRPVATTEQLDIELSESIDTALTIRESNTPTTDDVRDLDQDLETGGYLQVATDFEADQLESATIEFTAPTEALETADGDIDLVSLYHFDPDANEWRSLETTAIDEVGGEIRFSAAVDGFSQFAVGIGTPDMDTPSSTSDEMRGDETSDVNDDDSSADDSDRNGVIEDVDDGTPGFSVGITLLAIVVFLAAFGRFRETSTHG